MLNCYPILRERQAVEKLSIIRKPKPKKPTAYSLLVRTSVDAAADVDGMDAIVELTGMYLQCAAEVSAHASSARR
ncbi:hypothetical protein [Shewanella sp.]|uniref:hypothetical protein n=1 Tax=Shewanella sp. TaxID=50422 RepID=UPI0025D452F4|nr:hypothetical protein [Shewanella sp.]